jgi:BlaI family transcriptional regulator, penicillinase repressor
LTKIRVVDIRFLSLYRRQRMTPHSRNRHSTPPPMPTAAEVDILAALWRLGPATVREVHDALDKDRSYTTTLKQMQLMIDRGLLVRTERFGAHVYESGVPMEQMQKRIAGDLMRRVFGGSAKNLVMGALSAQSASKEDLADIRKMIDALEKRKRGSK